MRISDQSPLVTVEYHRDAVQHFYVATVAMARMGLCATVTALLEYFLRISDQNIIQQQQWCGLVGGWPTTVPDLTFPSKTTTGIGNNEIFSPPLLKHNYNM